MFPLCLMFFCFFLPIGSLVRALINRAEAEGTISIWASPFWMVSFTVILRPFNHQLPWWSHHQAFMETDPGGNFWGQDRYHTAFSTGTQQIHKFDSFGLNLGGMVKVAGVGWTSNLKTKESCTFVSSELKAKSLHDILLLSFT